MTVLVMGLFYFKDLIIIDAALLMFSLLRLEKATNLLP